MFNSDEVHSEYAEFVYKYLLSLCRNAEIAEELTQETFFRAIKASNRYNGTCKVSTWLCQIAKHVWYQEIERSNKIKEVELNETTVLVGQCPEEEVILKADTMNLMKLIHSLDEISKEIVLLRIMGDFSFKDIANIFEKNENWARVTFYRAKQKIIKEASQ